MKRYFIIPVFSLLLITCNTKKEVAQNSSSETVEKKEEKGIEFFQGTLVEAMKVAAEEGKLVFVDGYAVWCGPCKLLDKHTFPDKKVGAYFNEHFISVKLDMERGEGFAASQKYKVNAYPTLLILDSEGNEVGRNVGFLYPNDLIDFGKKYEK